MSAQDLASELEQAGQLAILQSHLAAIVENSEDAIISKTLDGTISTWNAAAERMLGYTADEIVGRPVSLLFPPDRLREEAVILSKIRHGERVAHFETIRLAKDGRAIPVSLTVSPIRDPAGRIVGASKILRDTTARKRAEDALRDSETRHRAILEASLDGILTIDEQGIIESINPAGQRQFGYGAGEVIGQNVRMLMPEPHRDEHDSYVNNYCVGGPARVIGVGREVVGLRKDGTTFPMELAVTELRLSGRRIFSGTIHDITERKRAERALREGEERFRTIADTIPQMMWTGNPDGLADFYNARWFQYTGLSADQSLGEGWKLAMHPEDVPTAASAWANCVRTGVPYNGESRFRRGSDGVYRWFVVWAMQVRNEDGSIKQWIGTCTDVDDLRRAQQEAAARVEAEAANQAKSEFLANMSHEIRTPMTAILGYADELLDPNQTPSDRQNAVNVIRRNGDHLLTVINDILDLSKIEAGQMAVEIIPCSPCQVLAEVTSLMRVRAKEKNLEFEAKIDGAIPRTIHTDPTRLRQILINLIANAVKFTEAGYVRLMAKLIDPPESANPRLRFEVSDSGIGMTSEQVGKLFQPFVQADNSTARRFGGSGLGLTISQRLARALGGEITMESAVGLGSKFAVTLTTGSLSGVEMLSSDSADALYRDGAHTVNRSMLRLRGKILLAEDGRDNQALLSVYLRKAGAEVVVAENGRIAYETIVASKTPGGGFAIDLILMDMQMPELDGYGATAKLRAAGYIGPIIALTAHAMATDRARCLKAGCTDYLSKPIKREDLIKAVHRHLGNSLAQADQITNKDEDLLNKFRPEYIRQLPQHVHQLLTYLSQEKPIELTRLAHNLKGTAGMYHFTEISELASDIEEEIRHVGSVGPVELRVRKLAELIRAVEGYNAQREHE
jgi:PAS domain S-box-containing protein